MVERAPHRIGLRRGMAALALVLSTVASWGVAPTASDAELTARTHALAEELRCVVCQNQTLADSQSDLAADLRSQVREQLAQGRSEDQVKDYMVQRYGDFVLYRPALRAATWLLWFGPLLLLAVGLVVLGWRWSRVQGADWADVSDDEPLSFGAPPPSPTTAAPTSALPTTAAPTTAVPTEARTAGAAP